MFMPRISGVLMLGVLSLNMYIGLKDVVLFKLQPAHQAANFVIIVVDLIAASFLIYYGQGKRLWVALAGVLWPAVYLLVLLADIESRLCLFSGQNCFSSVQVAYEYLILGSVAQGWHLWPFTILTVISLLSVTLILSAVHTFTYR